MRCKNDYNYTGDLLYYVSIVLSSSNVIHHIPCNNSGSKYNSNRLPSYIQYATVESSSLNVFIIIGKILREVKDHSYQFIIFQCHLYGKILCEVKGVQCRGQDATIKSSFIKVYIVIVHLHCNREIRLKVTVKTSPVGNKI